MAITDTRVDHLEVKILDLYKKEAGASQSWLRGLTFIQRWVLMLYREYLKDDVQIRAQSLAFLMIFSLLPLVAGAFFVFTIFTQFGMVQEAIGGFVNRFLETIPAEHRNVVLDYTLKFKDAYLASISGKSGSLGIFALAFLIWVGLSTFNNIDRTLNFIWSSEKERPFMEKVRNFLVVVVAAPLAIIAGLSVPLVLGKIAVTRHILEVVPFLSTLLNLVVPIAVILGIFTMLYRYVPVRRVNWKPALMGACFAAVFLQLANLGMNFYFRFGTHSAYGKAAIVPLIVFWIYLVWIIVILGAELGYLVQEQKYLYKSSKNSPTLSEVETFLKLLQKFHRHHKEGLGPVSFESLFVESHLEVKRLKNALRFLESRNLIVEALPNLDEPGPFYTLQRDISSLLVRDLLVHYLSQNQGVASENSQSDFQKALWHMTSFFGNKTVETMELPA